MLLMPQNHLPRNLISIFLMREMVLFLSFFQYMEALLNLAIKVMARLYPCLKDLNVDMLWSQ